MMKVMFALERRITLIHLDFTKIADESLKNELPSKMNCQNKGCTNFEGKLVRTITKHYQKGPNERFIS